MTHKYTARTQMVRENRKERPETPQSPEKNRDGTVPAKLHLSGPEHRALADNPYPFTVTPPIVRSDKRTQWVTRVPVRWRADSLRMTGPRVTDLWQRLHGGTKARETGLHVIPLPCSVTRGERSCD